MMRRLTLLLTAAVTASAALLAAPSAMAATTTSSTYSFYLNPANTAVSPNGGTMCGPTAAGDWIRLTGLGIFDPAAQTVQAAGSFAHYTSSGTVVCRGIWKATAFTSFTDFGTSNHGQEGGVLSIVVTHYCTTMHMTMTGIPMTITSTVNAPPGYTEGSTVGDFTQPTGGTVVIQPAR